VEDDDRDGRHRPSLATGGPKLVVDRESDPGAERPPEAPDRLSDPAAPSRRVRAAPARRVRAYVGLGANLGDAAATLREGIHALAGLPGARLRAVSALYATAPVGALDQPEFRNAVAALDVPAGPDPGAGAITLLVALKGLERAFGRRERERWGPRELDLDLLVFGRARLAIDRPPDARSLDAGTDPRKAARLLEVPHRRAQERLFVLAPLADLAPGLVPPGWRETVESARRRRTAVEGEDAVRAIARWDADAADWVRG
jgi:2-amino-4-hydroxy-6-hydroxymethyldihydropteridine diphosphokinase